MTQYLNIHGNSNIVAYEILEDAIIVEFRSGKHRYYRYDYSNPGMSAVEEMKKLAIQGHGLNAYINKNARTRYVERW